jgi:hypothetical protein
LHELALEEKEGDQEGRDGKERSGGYNGEVDP